MLTNRHIYRMSSPQLWDFRTAAQFLDSVTYAKDSSLDGPTFARDGRGKSFNGNHEHPIGPWARSFMLITREECLDLQRKCWEHCWKRGAPLGRNNRKTYDHWRYCDQLCTEQYLDCLRAAHTSAFGNIAGAFDWVVNHFTDAKGGTCRLVGCLVCCLDGPRSSTGPCTGSQVISKFSCPTFLHLSANLQDIACGAYGTTKIAKLIRLSRLAGIARLRI